MASDFAQQLERGRGGDPAALEDLFGRWRPLLALQARALLGADLAARCDPADVVQEALAQAFADLHQFRGETQAEWVGWLRTILAGQASKMRRRHSAQRRDMGREQHGTGNWAADLAADPRETAQKHERAGRLAAAIAALPESMREVVVRRTLDRASWEEVAAALGKTSGAVRVTWTRALRRLRELLDGVDTDAASGSEEHHGESRNT